MQRLPASLLRLVAAHRRSADRPLSGALPALALVASLACAAATAAQCEVFKKTGPDNPWGYSEFGCSVSLSGDHLAVGASEPGPGSCLVYERFAGGWKEAAVLQASDGSAGFGCAVRVDGDMLLIGAPGHSGSGGAFVFERGSDGTWAETQILAPSDPAVVAAGCAVGLDGDIAALGVPAPSGGQGRVLIFERGALGWVETATILPPSGPQSDLTNGWLALQETRLVLGTPGKAYVFERSLSAPSWDLKATLAPANVEPSPQLTKTVALDGDTVLAGAASPGTVYEFRLVGGTWRETDRFQCSAVVCDLFGLSLDVDGDRAVISGWDVKSFGLDGTAYVYERDAAGWHAAGSFQGSDLVPGDGFAWSIDLAGDEVAVGSQNQWVLPSLGAVHLFAFGGGPFLTADGGAVSLSLGGAQELQLGACVEHAGDLHLLAGSAAGTSPGFAFGGFQVPLNPDAYLLTTLAHPGGPPLPGAFGVLDADGRATAAFAVPAGAAPSLAGLVLHHAYAVLDAATLQVEAVSAAVAVTLAP